MPPTSAGTTTSRVGLIVKESFDLAALLDVGPVVGGPPAEPGGPDRPQAHQDESRQGAPDRRTLIIGDPPVLDRGYCSPLAM